MKEIIRDAEKNRLLISAELKSDGESNRTDFREKMLINNHIEGILELKVYVTDNKKTYEYDTTGLGTLESLCLQQKVNTVSLKKILRSICSTVVNASGYMLEESNLVINPKYIFLDKELNPNIAYCSDYEKTLKEQIGSLAEYLMNRIDYHDEEAVLLIYTVFMKCREEGFSIRELIDFLDKGSLGRQKELKPFLSDISETDGDMSEYANQETDYRSLPEQRMRSSKILDIEEFENSSEYTDKDSKVAQKRNNLPLYIAAACIPVVMTVLSLKFGILRNAYGKTDIVKLFAVVLLGIGVAVYIIKKCLPLYEKNDSDIGKADKVNKGKVSPDKTRYKAVDRLKTGYGKNYSKREKEINIKDDATELLYAKSEHRENLTEIISAKKPMVVLESSIYPEIRVNSFPFLIGKDEKHMNYCLDFSGVSRRHAKIDRTAAGVTISDMNSTNGVYVNDRLLEPNEPCSINDGDTVVMGVCTYTVRKI